MTDDINFSKKGDRKLSQFIAHELLYDYVLQDLDDERRSAVEAFVNENKEAKLDLNRILRGREYTQLLSETIVGQELIENARKPTSYLQLILEKIKFDEWPVGVRLGLESILIAVGITAIALIIPWHQLMHLRWSKSSEVVLTEVQSAFFEAKSEESAAVANPTSKEKFPDEGLAESATSTTNMVVALNSSTTTSSSSTTSTSTTNPPLTKTTIVAAEKVEVINLKGKGLLFRGSLTVSNVGTVAPKITDGLAKIGGRKAGEVELGWLRGNGAYYHFTLPETRLDDVKALFGEYGKLKLAKEPHERVMPEGIIRLIINIQESK